MVQCAQQNLASVLLIFILKIFRRTIGRQDDFQHFLAAPGVNGVSGGTNYNSLSLYTNTPTQVQTIQTKQSTFLKHKYHKTICTTPRKVSRLRNNEENPVQESSPETRNLSTFSARRAKEPL